jgi:hypothetical protein
MRIRALTALLVSVAALAAGSTAYAHAPAPGDHSFAIGCRNAFYIGGKESFVFAQVRELLAHPEANRSVVTHDGGYVYGSQWTYFRSVVTWKDSTGRWLTRYGDTLRIRNGTSGALGMIGAWERFDPKTRRWVEPTGYNGSAMEPNSGVWFPYRAGAGYWIGGYFAWGPIAGHPTFKGHTHWTGWSRVTC